MEAKREAGVWGRVAAPPVGGQSREELQILLRNAQESWDLFQGLLGKLPRSRGMLRHILELEQANTACLKGMLVFSGQDTATAGRNRPAAPIRQSLARGYYLAKKAAAEYTARSVDPEFGVVYREMADREIRVCNFIVQIMGQAGI